VPAKEQPAPSAKPEDAKESKPRAQRGERPKRSRQDRGQQDIGMIAENESGWGDGMPAFLTQKVELPKK